VVITTDVITADAVPGSFARPVGVAAESEGDALGVTGQQFLHCPVAAECLPKQIVNRQGRLLLRETDAAHRRMVRYDDGAFDLHQGVAQMLGQRLDHPGRETHIVERPAHEVDIVVPAARELLLNRRCSSPG